MASFDQYPSYVPFKSSYDHLHNPDLPSKCPLQNRGDMLGSAENYVVAGIHDKQYANGGKSVVDECGAREPAER